MTESRDTLPPSLREIADEIGVPAALKLIEHYGGVRLFVPMTMPPDHPLAQLLGFAAAEKLSALRGGEAHFYIPRGILALRRLRNDELFRDYRLGMSCRNLALKYRLSERGVEKIIAAAGISRADAQMDLFGDTSNAA